MRQPSYGRGPNADAYDRLTAYETASADWYPEPGRYLRAIRSARETLAAGGRVKMDWTCHGLNATEFEAEVRHALDRRISAKGGERYSRFNDPSRRGVDPAFIRDRQSLADIARCVQVYQFSTRAVRERFANRLSSYND